MSMQEFADFIEPILEALAMGKSQNRQLAHEALWMLQRHVPNHPMVAGKNILVPIQTQPKALRLLGWPDDRIQEHRQRQRNYMQDAQQRQQRAPQAMSPDVIPSGAKTAGHRAGRPTFIDPKLANAAAGIGPRQWKPGMQSAGSPSRLVSMQSSSPRPTRSTGSRAPYGQPVRSTLVGERMPSAIPQSPSSQARIGQPQNTRITSANPQSPLVRLPSHASMVARMPSAVPQSPVARSPSQARTDPPQGLRILSGAPDGTPVRPPSHVRMVRPQGKLIPPGVTSNSGPFMWPNDQGLPPRPAPTPTVGLFPPPLSRSTTGQSDAPRRRSPMDQAQKTAYLDQKIEEGLRKLQRVYPEACTQTRAWLGQKQGFERKRKLLEQLQFLEQKQKRAAQQGQVMRMTSKKRKDHPNAAEQSHPKRQVIDLTLPSREQLSQREPHPPISFQTPSGTQINVVPVPDLSGPDALHAHATLHGISMHDVELNPNIYSTLTARIFSHASTFNAQFPERILRPKYKVHPDQKLTIWEAEPSIADAIRKVKTGGFDWKWSEGREEDLEDVEEEVLRDMGCMKEEGGWRAPELRKWSEERAVVDWELRGKWKTSTTRAD
jgi:hypothetical protein